MVSKLDQAICHRFRVIREVLGYSQGEVAAALQVTRERIASYEHARAPLRFHFADAFCAMFSVNQHWLATGEGLVTPYIEKPKGLAISDRALFSEAYDAAKETVLSETAAYWARISPPRQLDASAPVGRVVIKNASRDRTRAVIHSFAEEWLSDTPDEFLDELANRLWACGEAITRDMLNEKIRVILNRDEKP